MDISKKTYENTERAMKSCHPRETGNIGYTRRRQTKHKHNIICVGHHYAQTNKNNVNKKYKQLEVKTNRTWFLYGNRNGHTELRT